MRFCQICKSGTCRCPDRELTFTEKMVDIGRRRERLEQSRRRQLTSIEDAQRKLAVEESGLRSLDDALTRLRTEEDKLRAAELLILAREKLVRDIQDVQPGDYVEARFKRHHSEDLFVLQGVIETRVFLCDDGTLEGTYQLVGMTFRSGNGQPGDLLHEIIKVTAVRSNS